PKCPACPARPSDGGTDGGGESGTCEAAPLLCQACGAPSGFFACDKCVSAHCCDSVKECSAEPECGAFDACVQGCKTSKPFAQCQLDCGDAHKKGVAAHARKTACTTYHCQYVSGTPDAGACRKNPFPVCEGCGIDNC